MPIVWGPLAILRLGEPPCRCPGQQGALLEVLLSANALTDEASTFRGLIALLDTHFGNHKNIVNVTYDLYFNW